METEITDPNCIVKAFQNNNISIIKDESNKYYFRGSDVAKALEITNVRSSIQNFTSKEKGVRKVDTLGGPQDIIFLSSHGVYRLLYSSKKKIAQDFREWVGDILDDIIFNQSKELQRQLEEKEQLLIEQKEQTELEKEQLLEKTLLNQFPNNTQCIYYGKVDNKDVVGGSLVKFGMSNNLQERVKTHKKTYTNFRLTNVFKVSNQIEIENCIKKHPILKKRIRNIMINDMNYRELICIDSTRQDPAFSLEKLNEYIEQIIEENQYNIENYNRLLKHNSELELEIIKLQNENKSLKQGNDKLQEKINQFKPSVEENLLKKHNKTETNSGYSLFAFDCNNVENQKISRYKIGLCKTSTVELREKAYKSTYENGNIKHCVKLKHPFMEKVLLYLLKRHVTFLNNDLYDASVDDVKLIFNIIFKIEELLINNDLYNIMKILNNETLENVINDPEIPFVRKAKRSIDQIDKDTGKIGRAHV